MLLVEQAPSNAYRLGDVVCNSACDQIGSRNGHDAIRSGGKRLKRVGERSGQGYFRKFLCNHAEMFEVAGIPGPSMIAACALALVSSGYNTIKGRMRAAG